jgi:hypothetical protein
MNEKLKELAKPEQSKYTDIVSDGGLDPRNKFDAQPEQEPFKPEQEEKRCQYCDGTGEVHDIDGEWRGSCNCGAKPEQEPFKPDWAIAF